MSLKVSAIIPVYNGKKFLAETIESVLAQTYPDIECIVVNDGSTDETAEVANSFGDRIRYYGKRNGGVSSARNFGIERSTGELIAFLDADDLWLPSKIAKQVELFSRFPNAGLVYTAIQVVDSNGKITGEVRGRFEKDPLVRLLLLETPVYLTMTGLAPRKVFESIGGFDERLSTSADADMACRIALRYELKAIDEPLACYRQHGDQMHHNLKALEHDMTIVYQKVFESDNLPDSVRSLRARAKACLESTLAIAYFRLKNLRRSFSHFLKAVKNDVSGTARHFGRVFAEKF